MALGDIAAPHIERLGDNLGLVPGDLGLSTFEDRLSDAWPRAMDRDEAAFRTLTAFHRIAQQAAARQQAQVVIIDVGPNLGAINRAALLAAQHVVTPLAPDLFSVHPGARCQLPSAGSRRRFTRGRADQGTRALAGRAAATAIL